MKVAPVSCNQALRGEENFKPHPQNRVLVSIGNLSKISNENPHPFYVGSLSPPLSPQDKTFKWRHILPVQILFTDYFQSTLCNLSTLVRMECESILFIKWRYKPHIFEAFQIVFPTASLIFTAAKFSHQVI